MDTLKQFLDHKRTMAPSKATKFIAGAVFLQGAIVAYQLLNTSKVTDLNEKRLEYVCDIIGRNIEQLDEFDLIALNQLGLFKRA